MSYISAAQAKQIAQKAVDNLKDGTLVPKLADNLTPYTEDSGTTQTQPFFLEGTATGNGESRVDAKQVPAYAFLQEKRGNMVCVNQLAKEINSTNWTSGDSTKGTVSFNGNEITYTVITPGDSYSNGIRCYTGIFGRLNHTYLLLGEFKSNKNGVRIGVDVFNVTLAYQPFATLTTSYQVYGTLITGSSDSASSTAMIICTRLADNIESGDSFSSKNVILVDLTQWFNGNIPAYLLSHPEAFGRYYKGSLAYEPGRLEPATGRYLTSDGRNIWDEEWELGYIDNQGVPQSSNSYIRSKNYISVSSITEYFLRTETNAMYFTEYDAEYNFIKQTYKVNTTITTQSNTAYVKFYMGGSYGTTYKNDITISRYYPGESGYDKYYPHEVLATIDTGTESLYSVGTVYDSKVPSGLITRRIGSYTFTGNETWTKNSNGYQSSISGFSDLVKRPSANNVIFSNQINSAGLKGTSPDRLYVGTEVSGIGIATNGDVWIGSDDYANISTLTGKTIYFELAEPTTEQGTPFQENVPIDDFGQLSWSDTDVPQGNQIFYPVDYKAYEDTLIKYTDGDATSLALKGELASGDPQTLKGLVDYVNGKIPAAPTTDGTYDLVCTVMNGEPTFSWVART